MPLCILFAILAYFAYIRIQSEKIGYIIDINSDLFEFPGRSSETDNWLDYFRFSFWKSEFGGRGKIKISQIREISREVHKSTSYVKDSKGNLHEKVTRNYTINLNGEFGTQTLTLSQGRRDELYSLLREINNMGKAVFEVQ